MLSTQGPFCKIKLTLLGAALRFFLFLKIRFWDELGPYGRWGAVQHVKIKFISIRAFLVSKKACFLIHGGLRSEYVLIFRFLKH